jgi:hypothetical protein
MELLPTKSYDFDRTGFGLFEVLHRIRQLPLKPHIVKPLNTRYGVDKSLADTIMRVISNVKALEKPGYQPGFSIPKSRM